MKTKEEISIIVDPLKKSILAKLLFALQSSLSRQINKLTVKLLLYP